VKTGSNLLSGRKSFFASRNQLNITAHSRTDRCSDKWYSNSHCFDNHYSNRCYSDYKTLRHLILAL